MRVAVYPGAGRPIVIEERPMPKPGPGDVLVRIARCGICGSDVSMTSGSRYDYPARCDLGHEYAGEVFELGAKVERLRIGDRVACLPVVGCGACPACFDRRPHFCGKMRGFSGGFGDFITVAESVAYALPASLSVADGAFVEPMACGRRALNLAHFRPGQTLLVLGGGTVALAMIFWARLMGAAEIRVASRSAQRREVVMAFGADSYHSFEADDPEEWIRAQASPPDMVAECVGKVDMLDQAIDLVRMSGTVISMGMCMAPEPLVAARCAFKEVSLVFPIAFTIDDFEATVRAFDADKIHPETMVSEIIALDELPAMIDRMRSGTRTLKIHVDPSKSILTS